METICDYIDGSESIFCAILVQVIQFSIKHDTLEQIDTLLPGLAPYKNTVFLSKFSRESKIDASLVCLSVLSYLTPKRPDIVALIENLFRENA